MFEIRAQVEGYRQRIEENRADLKSLQDTLGLIEARKRKLALEQALVRMALEKNRTMIAEYERAIEAKITLIGRERMMLAGLLRELDRAPKDAVALAFSARSLSGLMDIARGIELSHRALQDTVRAVREDQRNLEKQKRNLEERREELVLLHEVYLRQQLRLVEEDDQKRAIQAYAGKRTVLFEELLRRSEVASVTLQEEFFKQEGVGKRLTLQEVFARADAVTKQLSLRPAFLLALVAQESKFGAFQGSGFWKDDMHPSQWPVFLSITQRLGLDPDRVPVSKKPDYGWGGAMGPAQFLPGTWVGYEDRIRQITGHAAPSPWNIDDALAGAAIKLAEAGASEQSEGSERKAALMYFAGGNWQNPDFAFYADSILELAKEIEAELHANKG
ncbi:MAG: hypothetical protein Q8Q39_01260 [bacterium]|nr:hypothetical protein [bacterium]